MEKICLLIESNMGEIPLCMPSWLYSCFYEKTAHRHHGTFVCFFLWMGTRKHRTHTLKGNTYPGPSSLADVRSTCTQQTLNSRRLTMCSSPKELSCEVRPFWRRVRSVLARVRSVLEGVAAIGEPLLTGGVGGRGVLGHRPAPEP